MPSLHPIQVVMQGKAQTWARASFGPVLLKTVAGMYRQHAHIYGGTILKSVVSRFKGSNDNLRKRYAVLSTTLRVARYQLEAER